MPKISVIIPVYNVEKYLRECLDSIINQTLTDIEIICVNDGSKDNSILILKEYAKKDNRIIIIDKENTGAGDSRNVGLNKATGEYLHFMDSDDFLEITAYQKLYEKIKKEDSDICICQQYVLDEETKTLSLATKSINTKILPKNTSVFSQKDIKDNIFQLSGNSPFTKLYKKDFIQNNNFKFQNTKTCNDVYFHLVTSSSAQKITYIKEPLVIHRCNQTDCLTFRRGKTANCVLIALNEVKNFLKEKNLFTELKHSFYRRAIDYFRHELSYCEEPQKNLLKNQFKDFLPYKYKLQFDIKNNLSPISKQLFSVKNNKRKTHKILTILGIKIKINIKRKNNSIYIVNNGTRKKVKKIPWGGVKIKFKGQNATIEIGANPLIRFENTEITVDDNSYISIGSSDKFIKNLKLMAGKNNKVIIGENFSCEGLKIINHNESNLKIQIGNDCMFSSDIYLRSSDGHTIYDINTNKILNKPKINSITIENHCWIGNGVSILKGSKIKENTIVGKSALVNKEFTESNIILAGIPAKIVKKNVNWDRKDTEQY